MGLVSSGWKHLWLHIWMNYKIKLDQLVFILWVNSQRYLLGWNIYWGSSQRPEQYIQILAFRHCWNGVMLLFAVEILPPDDSSKSTTANHSQKLLHWPNAKVNKTQWHSSDKKQGIKPHLTLLVDHSAVSSSVTAAATQGSIHQLWKRQIFFTMRQVWVHTLT